MMAEETHFLDAGDFLPRAVDALPFGISEDSAKAIAGLRALADAMEQHRVVIGQVQTGTTVARDDFPTFRVFIEFKCKPF